MMLWVFLVLTLANHAYAQRKLVNCDVIPKCDIDKSEDMPLTEQSIQQACNSFRKFQECIENWGKQCYTEQQYQIFRERSEKPLAFTKKLCTDENYRNDYLKEKDSFASIGLETAACSQKYSEANTSDLSSETSIADSIKPMCCASEEYSRCLANSCGDKCSDKAKGILQDMLGSSLNFIQEKCKLFKDIDCGNKSSTATYSIIFIISTMTALMILR